MGTRASQPGGTPAFALSAIAASAKPTLRRLSGCAARGPVFSAAAQAAAMPVVEAIADVWGKANVYERRLVRTRWRGSGAWV
ncbi:hypothetical protein KRR38_08820 [Novosphingobium sp. G106]|uniref:hypothetical protein n=1 Tax=Novosphingobium sp. G106 TaxID=2849500 RepID=UPI001C2CE545|nr:hypothetical protein [Novosphingobium sp. G106]MBV1687775.1 hypothetical protein [Novosphingobium sp. G106]